MIDAHIHLFDGGYQGHPLLGAMKLNDLAYYDQWRQMAGVTAALVVGWEGAPWSQTNNVYIAALATSHSWIKPLAFVANPKELRVADLEQWAKLGFVGISVYTMDETRRGMLGGASPDVWNWLEHKRWIISVNSRAEGWRAWNAVLERFPELNVLVSHLGLPPAAKRNMTDAESRQALVEVLELVKYKNVLVKLSGFYAMTQPGSDYPHTTAWPYVQTLIDVFGVDRLIWGSDFSPCLQLLSMPQTYDLFPKIPFMPSAAIPKILGGNLERVLNRVT